MLALTKRGLRRVPGLARAYRFSRRCLASLAAGLGRLPARAISYERLPAPAAVRIAYQVMLRREPDPEGFSDNLAQLASGALTRSELAQAVRGSEEFQNIGFTDRLLGPSIHAGRCEFIRALPKAARIVDLGGTHLANEVGALVALGYPYPFEELTIVDLPSPRRHEIYRSQDHFGDVNSPLGRVSYRYHSMTDLSSFADSSVDLVYSGQSIEHVTVAEGRKVLAEVRRILRPGGHLAIDTPNARVTRIMQEKLIDPDHKVEYTWPELRELITDAGLEVVRAQGLNYAGRCVECGTFDADEVACHWGLHDAIEDCFILAVVARRP
jgi:hypothetical protein